MRSNYIICFPIASTYGLSAYRTGHADIIIKIYIFTSFLRSIQEFPKLLAIGVDTLLASCNDDESDVRLVAGEALNKLLKVGIFESIESKAWFAPALFVITIAIVRELKRALQTKVSLL